MEEPKTINKKQDIITAAQGGSCAHVNCINCALSVVSCGDDELAEKLNTTKIPAWRFSTVKLAQALLLELKQ